MAVEYQGHFLRTRRQVIVQTSLLMLVLLPLLARQMTTERPIVSFALALLTFLPVVLVYKSWQFLATQEKEHAEPTPAMNFVFHIVTTIPIAMAAPLMILLFER
jgi:hypothetical protein